MPPLKICYIIVICELRLELLPRNTEIDVKLAILWSVWPWNCADELENNRVPLICNWRLVHHFIAICELELQLSSWNTEMGSNWRMLILKLCRWPRKKETSSMPIGDVCIIQEQSVNWNGSYRPETKKSGSNWRFSGPIWPWNWWDVFEKQIVHPFCAHWRM